jgi:uncharacterized protein YceK
MRPRLLAIVAVLAFALAGCGTVMNLSTPPTPVTNKETGEIEEQSYVFGGVRQSAGLGIVGVGGGTMLICAAPFAPALSLFAPELLPFAGAGGLMMVGTGGMMVAGGALALVDAPFSLVGDVVTLPFALVREHQAYQLAEKARARAAAAPLPVKVETAPAPAGPPKTEGPKKEGPQLPANPPAPPGAAVPPAPPAPPVSTGERPPDSK